VTGKERIGRILERKPVDRIGLFEHFWGDTQNKWSREGYIRSDEDLADHFGFDISLCWPFDLTADLDFEPEVLEETEETILVRDGNGAVLRRHKLHDSTPEHVDFLVKDRRGWEEHIKPLLTPDPRRIDFEAYRKAKEKADEENRFFVWAGVNVFESIHPVCGHEYMLMGMALDPEWVKDMVNTYSQLIIELQEILFAQAGYPDGIWFYEDMGFKGRPFMSPAMYKEIIQPAHQRTIDFAHSRGLPVIMHSCGMVEPLVPGMLAAGIDCLQVIEVKAGMDLIKLYKDYGDRLSFMGGIDVRVLYSNDRQKIDQELLQKVPIVKGRYGYVLHSDHSIPDTVDYETYRYFVDRGLNSHDQGRELDKHLTEVVKQAFEAFENAFECQYSLARLGVGRIRFEPAFEKAVLHSMTLQPEIEMISKDISDTSGLTFGGASLGGLVGAMFGPVGMIVGGIAGYILGGAFSQDLPTLRAQVMESVQTKVDSYIQQTLIPLIDHMLDKRRDELEDTLFEAMNQYLVQYEKTVQGLIKQHEEKKQEVKRYIASAQDLIAELGGRSARLIELRNALELGSENIS